MRFRSRFFIPVPVPIDSPDLGDGPLRGENFVRRAYAEKRAFYRLSCMLQIGTNALFRSEIAISVSKKLRHA